MSRPRKTVFLYCHDELRRSQLLTVLRVRASFARVEAFARTEELIDAAGKSAPYSLECVVLLHSSREPQVFDAVLRALPTETNSLEVRRFEDRFLPDSTATVTLGARVSNGGEVLECGAAELVDVLRLLCGRKHGPRRKSRSYSVAMELKREYWRRMHPPQHARAA